MQYLLTILGGGFLLFGLFGYGVEIDNLLSGTSARPILGFVIATCFTVAGAAMIRAARKRKAKAIASQAAERERLVLELARRNNGDLTPAIVAADSSMTLVEATTELDRLAALGACELEFGEDTPLFYRFTRMLSGSGD